MDFLNFIRIIRKRILILAIFPLVAVALTIFATRKQPKIYSSYVMISMGLTGGSVSLDASAKAFELMKQTMNMLELAKSRSVYEEVGFHLLRHDLTSDQPFRISMAENPDFTFHDIQHAVFLIDQILSDTIEVELSREENYLIKKLAKDRSYDFMALAKSFKIYQIGDSDFIRILLEDKNSEYIIFALNTITDVFIKKYRQLVAGESSRSRKFFAKQVEEAAHKLRDKEEELKAFKEENNIIMLSEQIKSVVSQLEKFEDLLDENEQTIETLKASIWKIESKFSDSNSILSSSELIIQNKEIVGLTNKLKKLEKEYLIRKYENEDNDIAGIESEINELRKKIKDLVQSRRLGNYLDPQTSRQDLASRLINNQIELEMTRARREVISREVERLNASANSFAPLEAKYAQLNREIQVAEQEYLEMLEKLNLARAYESNSLSSTNLKVVEQAFPPQYPLASKRKILVILAGLGSFIFGVMSIFIMEYFDVSLRTIKQVERLTEISAVSGVPKIDSDPENHDALLKQPQNLEQQLFKESLRNLRNHISNLDGDHHMLVMTSSKTEEGKSLLTTKLGISFARAHRRTLLVDANFRKPTLEKYLGLRPTNYIQDVLFGNLSLDEGITETGIENLSVLCAKESDDSITEIGGLAPLHRFIQEMKESFDMILFDTPAMNGYSDTMEILNEADISLFIVKSGNTFHEADRRNLHMLKKSKARLVGVVLNEMGWDFLDPIFGEIEKPRSAVRIFVKRLLTRQFSSLKKCIKE